MWKYFVPLIVLFLLLPGPVSAQQITWDPPVSLTDEGTVVQFSAITADMYGGIHVFWAYKANSGEPTNLLFYRYRNETGWSEAVDIFVGSASELFERPTVICDKDNYLHLLWNGAGGLYYSSALATEAFDPRQWQVPSLVVQADALRQTSLVMTADGVLHVTYTRQRTNNNLMYVRSEDRGISWSVPLPISEVLPGDEQVPDSATMILDTLGVLHLVWVENYPPEYLGRHVLYARSEDAGLTWTRPQIISDPPVGEGWNAEPNIVVDNRNTLHVIWAGCRSDGISRCYRFSDDSGLTWSAIAKPFQHLIGSAGRDALAADPYGNVYWAGSLRYPQSFYFSLNTDTIWSDPPRTLFDAQQVGPLGSAHFPNMLISQGNQLHLLLVEGDGGALTYVHGQTSNPSIEIGIPESRPTSTPLAAEVTAEPDISLPQSQLDRGTMPPLGTFDPTQPQTGLHPIVLTLIVTVGFLAVAIVIFKRRTRF